MTQENHEFQCPEWRLPIILSEVKKGTLIERISLGQKEQTRAPFHDIPFGLIGDILEAGKLRIDEWLKEQIGLYGKLNESSVNRYLFDLGMHTSSCDECRGVYERFQKIGEISEE